MTKKADLDPVDQEALERALVLIVGDNYARTIERVQREEDWFEAATRAARHLQEQNLRLKPWQPPPCYARLEDALTPDGPNDVGGKQAAARLLRRLLAAGLSRYEPDPLGALEKVKKAQNT